MLSGILITCDAVKVLYIAQHDGVRKHAILLVAKLPVVEVFLPSEA